MKSLAGSEIETPMTVVILSGLPSPTLVNMIIVPGVYFRLRNRRGEEMSTIL